MSVESLMVWAANKMPFKARESHPDHLPYMKAVNAEWQRRLPSLMAEFGTQNAVREAVKRYTLPMGAEIAALALGIIMHESAAQPVCFIGQYPNKPSGTPSEKYPNGRAYDTLDNGLGLGQITTGFYNGVIADPGYAPYVNYPHWALLFPAFSAHFIGVALHRLVTKRGGPKGALFAWAGATTQYPTAEAYATKPNGLYPYYQRELAALK